MVATAMAMTLPRLLLEMVMATQAPTRTVLAAPSPRVAVMVMAVAVLLAQRCRVFMPTCAGKGWCVPWTRSGMVQRTRARCQALSHTTRHYQVLAAHHRG